MAADISIASTGSLLRNRLHAKGRVVGSGLVPPNPKLSGAIITIRAIKQHPDTFATNSIFNDQADVTRVIGLATANYTRLPSQYPAWGDLLDFSEMVGAGHASNPSFQRVQKIVKTSLPV